MSAARAFVVAFREPDLMPDALQEWFDGRMGRYAVYRSLYHNNLYWQSNRLSATFKQNFKLFPHIDGIYNPYYRLVELNVGKLMGGAIDWDNLKTGAIPVTDADETLIEALIQLYKWSKWGTNKSLYARLAAMMGDCGLWVYDDPAREKVMLEVIDPAKIKEAQFDSVGNVTAVTLEYQRDWYNPERLDANGKPRMEIVTYRLEADKERFATFKEDRPFAWQTDARGNPTAEWDNPYGFVPLALANFRDLGLRWGASCLHASIPKINKLNDLASILTAGARKAADPPFYAPGVTQQRDLIVPERDDDETPIIGGPKDSDIKSLAPDIDYTGLNEALSRLEAELEMDAPELAMHRLREMGQMSGVAIRTAYTDASARLLESMGNLDDALIRASQMAISIGAYRRYDGFRAFSLDSYKAGNLDFGIKERDLFEDAFTPQERVQILQSLPDNPRIARHILVNELQVSEADADTMLAASAALPSSNGGVTIQPPAQLSAGESAADVDDDVVADVNAMLSEFMAVA